MGDTTKTCKHPDGCDRKVKARGMCSMHYERLRASGDVGPARNQRDTCKHPEGCPLPAHTRGWCPMHAMRAKSNGGDPGPVGRLRPEYKNLGDACEHPDGCDREPRKRGLCNMHYLRLSRTGELGPAEPIKPRDKAWTKNPHRIPKSRIPEIRQRTLDEQGGVCEVCGLTDPNDMWVLDHDHSCCEYKGGGRVCTLCVRGVLCNKCNTALGYFYDDPSIMRRAAAYVEAYRSAK